MGRILTLRGVVPQGRRERVFFFDSNIQNRGWKIKDFQILPNDVTTGYSTLAVLHSTDITITFADWDANTTIAFAITSQYAEYTPMVDSDHVIVGNLYLTNLTPNQPVSYLITLEEEDITPSQNIMYQLKEVAQNSANN